MTMSTSGPRIPYIKREEWTDGARDNGSKMTSWIVNALAVPVEGSVSHSIGLD